MAQGTIPRESGARVGLRLPGIHVASVALPDGAVSPVELAKTAGVTKTNSPYSLGPTAITLALNSGANLRDIQDLARHAEPRIARRYARPRGALVGMVGGVHASDYLVDIDFDFDHDPVEPWRCGGLRKLRHLGGGAGLFRDPTTPYSGCRQSRPTTMASPACPCLGRLREPPDAGHRRRRFRGRSRSKHIPSLIRY